MPAPVTTFEELNLPPAMMANITRCKYTQPTPVQRYAIPIGISGRDLMACAQVRRVWVEAGSGSAVLPHPMGQLLRQHCGALAQG